MKGVQITLHIAENTHVDFSLLITSQEICHCSFFGVLAVTVYGVLEVIAAMSSFCIALRTSSFERISVFTKPGEFRRENISAFITEHISIRCTK